MKSILIVLVMVATSAPVWAHQSSEPLQKTNFDGYYQRFIDNKPDSDSAYIEITQQQNGEYLVSGSAVWVMDASTGSVNVGDIYGEFPEQDNRLYYDLEECRITITFTQQALIVSDDNMQCGGMNVSFNGHYRKDNEQKMAHSQ
ncbi:hypothetical protein VII00023_08889 [Vibrio ichthyoenteri ATCC 700023]|uniref:Lipoprotein n=1 Tax=Vibrio ichthyoenteri ATCC 700023 TaxID=870968 RepID=F9S577_9VIBR|nr:hypothetical protein [Vibrio ichthyoenteri]EGU35943.1 hypothetical protein VII00023_08889 [Vibrio ichthyoenteri ATCC 700023]